MPCVFDYFKKSISFDASKVNDLRQEITKEHLNYAVQNDNYDAVVYCHDVGVKFEEDNIITAIQNNSYLILSFIKNNIRYLSLENKEYLRYSIKNNKLNSFTYLLSEIYEDNKNSINDEIYYIIDEKNIEFIEFIFDNFLINDFDFNYYEYSVKNAYKEVYEYFENLLKKNNQHEYLSKCIKFIIQIGLNNFDNIKNFNEYTNKWLGINSIQCLNEDEDESSVNLEDNEDDSNVLRILTDNLYIDSINIDENDEDLNIEINENKDDLNVLRILTDNLYIDSINIEENDENLNIEINENEDDLNILRILTDNLYIDSINIEENDEDLNIKINDNDHDSNVLKNILNY